LRNAADRHVLGLHTDETPPLPDGNANSLPDRVAAFEKSMIASALAAHGGSLKPVYESLGISRKTLYEKMQKYGLDKRRLGSGGDAD
jgi:two-component system C4-dicarboxylate transport response regulator DctD